MFLDPSSLSCPMYGGGASPSSLRPSLGRTVVSPRPPPATATARGIPRPLARGAGPDAVARVRPGHGARGAAGGADDAAALQVGAGGGGLHAFEGLQVAAAAD